MNKIIKTAIAAGAVLALAGGISACEHDNGTPKDDVGTQDTRLGPVLTDTDDRTMYVLKGGECAGQCLDVWPRAEVSGDELTKASSVSGKVTVDGNGQLSVNGQKLYTYVQDTAPGDVNGQGVKDTWGVWWVVNTEGEIVKPAAPDESGSPDESGKPSPDGSGSPEEEDSGSPSGDGSGSPSGGWGY